MTRKEISLYIIGLLLSFFLTYTVIAWTETRNYLPPDPITNDYGPKWEKGYVEDPFNGKEMQ